MSEAEREDPGTPDAPGGGEPPDSAEGGGPATYNLLFVCSGNTCRSPMAAAIARKRLEARGWKHVAVASAGIGAAAGAAAAENAVRVAAEHGLDLSTHRSAPVTPELAAWADLILGMTLGHLEGAARMGGGDRAALVTDFLSGAGAGSPIEDPFGGGLPEYRVAYDQLAAAVDAVLARLEPILAP